jgi:putative peptidoglycan lipid II flippase
MPPAVSDRYHLEMRLGRDGDVEEWLATDTSLERPVLIRSLGPESSSERRHEFVASVGDAARTTHPHLIRVFAVEEVEGGAYAVCEWNGGATVADRIAASQTMDLSEFLPNAAGLAGALATLHETGGVHGSLDLSALSYSVAHPAKLGAWGRHRETDAGGDVVALATALETALTGVAQGGPPPSESIDGVPRAIDRVLRSAQSGRLDAGELEKALLASPTLRPTRPEPPSTSRRLLIAAVVLVLLAVGLVALGLVLTGGGPIIPVSPITTVGSNPSTTVSSPVTTVPAGGTVAVVDATSFDPFGEGGENDTDVANLVDGDPATRWRSERYRDPLSLQKPGVGLRFEVDGAPTAVELVDLSPGTELELRWATEASESLDDWSRVIGASSLPGSISLPLPRREGGMWLIWITDLPIQSDGSYYVELSEVRFLP